MYKAPNVGAISHSSLSVAQKRLLRIIQSNQHGRIENLAIRNGDPDLSKPPQVFRHVKFGGRGPNQPRSGKEDYNIKAQVQEMFMEFKKLKNGIVPWIEFQDGLPYRMSVKEKIRM